jgi:hypothetical protein
LPLRGGTARQVLGEGLARRPLAGEGGHLRGLGGGLLGGQFVRGGRSLQFLQLQLKLIQQSRGALRARAEALAVELGDQQLQMGDQRLIFGSAGSGRCIFGLDPRAMNPCRDQRRLERIDVIGEVVGRQIHGQK